MLDKAIDETLDVLCRSCTLGQILLLLGVDYLRGAGESGNITTLDVVDGGHKSAECGMLALFVLLRELCNSVLFCRLEIIEESLHSQLESIEGFGLNRFDEVLVCDELLVVRKSVVGEDSLIERAEPVVILLELLALHLQLVPELLLTLLLGAECQLVLEWVSEYVISKPL